MTWREENKIGKGELGTQVIRVLKGMAGSLDFIV